MDIVKELWDNGVLGGMFSTLITCFGQLSAMNSQKFSAVVDVLNSCTTYEELEAVVKDLQTLLSTTKQASEKSLTTEAVKKLASDKNGVIGGDYATLYYQVRHIVNSEAMDVVEKTANPEWTAESLKGIREKRIYYYSPFGIYYQWLNEYAYLPAN